MGSLHVAQNINSCLEVTKPVIFFSLLLELMNFALGSRPKPRNALHLFLQDPVNCGLIFAVAYAKNNHELVKLK